MSKRYSQDSFLPQISRSPKQKKTKAQTVYQRYTEKLNILKHQKQNHISKLLRQVRYSMKNNLQTTKSLQKQRFKKQQRKQNKQKFVNKKQKKVYYYQTTPTNQNQLTLPKQTIRRISNLVPHTVQVQQIQSLQKPPHRSKTTMCIQNNKIYLYGGIGCQPNLKLAIFDLQTKKWIFPQDQTFSQYHPTTPLTGHSFGCYKGKGYVYGGKSTDIVNELSILNLKDYKFTQGEKCQYRRRDHAMIFISKFMIIQGGIQSGFVANSMYFYNTQTNTWIYPVVSQTLPFLYNHGMASTFPAKTKRKQINSLSELVDPIFIFGGKDKKGKLQNSLYKITFQNETFLAIKIEMNLSIWPQRRMQMAFESIGNGYILLYGGKMIDQQTNGQENRMIQSKVYSLNCQKLQWSQLQIFDELPHRHGMAVTSYNGKIYMFGGFMNNKYANANITVLTGWNPDMLKTKTNFGTRTFLSKQLLF